MRRPHLPPRFRLLARVVFFAVLIVLFALALHGKWHQIGISYERLSWYSLLIATLLGFGNIFAAMMAWRSLLADLDSPLRVSAHARAAALELATALETKVAKEGDRPCRT